MRLHFLFLVLGLTASSVAFSANEREPAKAAAPSDCDPACVWVDKAGNKRVTVTRAYVSPDFPQPRANIKGLEPVRAKDSRGILNVDGL